MTEEEFVLTQERIDNIEAHCMSIEKDLAWHKENTTSGDWLEKRVIALEHQVRELTKEAQERKRKPGPYARMREHQLKKEFQYAKGTETAS